MKGLRADLLHAFRHYWRTPVSSAIAVGMLAVAMAVLTAFLALWSDVALNAHAGFERGGQLVTIGRTDGRRMMQLTYGLLERINEEAITVDSAAGTITLGQFLEDGDDSVQFGTELVTEHFFPALRPRMQLGRAFDAADHAVDAEPVVIISDRMWRQRFDGRPEVLGQMLRVRGPNASLRMNNAVSNANEKVREYRIVGVAAPQLSGTFFVHHGLWMPYEPTVEHLFVEIGGLAAMQTGGLPIYGVARPAQGTGVAAIRSELQSRYTEAAELGMGMTAGVRLDAARGVVNDLNRQREALQQLHLFLGGSALLALVAACNISLFLLSRAPGRRRELAIRMAVGAPLRRLARQLSTEAAVLVIAATVLGVLLAVWVTAMLGEHAFLRQAPWREVTPLDWRVLTMVTGTALLMTVLVSLAPVVGLKRLGIATGSRSVTARANLTQRAAGTLQLSVAAVVSAAAIAFGWYLGELSRIDPGFSADDVYVVTMFPETPPQPTTEAESHLRERERRRELVSGLPGVEDVAFGITVPGQPREMWRMQLTPADDPQDAFGVVISIVDESYMRLLDLRLLDGRLLESSDGPEMVINETLARRIWGRVDVSGEILPMAGGGPARWEVVGVVRDVAFRHPSEEPEPMAFNRSSQLAAYEWLLVKTRRPAAELQQGLQQLIDAGELDGRIGMIRPIEELWGEALAPDRARTTLTAGSALLVVALATFGYFGTQRFLVAAGRREYAILSAVGAGPRTLGRLVLGRGLLLGAPGLVLGALLAFITVSWLRGDFVSASVSPYVITALVLVGIVVLLLLAGIGPARQARRTNAAPLLREE